MKTSIVIPAYNEEKVIARTLKEYLDVFNQQETEVLMVANGCHDQTVPIARTFENKVPNFTVQNIPEAIGKGGAVREGFRQAQGDLVAYIDADSSTSALELQRLIGRVGESDGVIASRWVPGAKVENRQSALRKAGSQVFHRLVKIFFSMPFTDTQCGAKVFRRQVIDRILDHTSVSDMTFDVEFLYLAHLAGFNIKEEPTVWIDRLSSPSLGTPTKFAAVSAEMLSSLLKLRLKHLGSKKIDFTNPAPLKNDTDRAGLKK